MLKTDYIYSVTDICHYNDVKMNALATQITSLTFVYLVVYPGEHQRKHQSSASLAFVWGFHQDRWIPRTNGQLRVKCFHLMTSSCAIPLWRLGSVVVCYTTYIHMGLQCNNSFHVNSFTVKPTYHAFISLCACYIKKIRVSWSCSFADSFHWFYCHFLRYKIAPK